MSGDALEPQTTALVLVDLQNDFLHPDGAYGRASQHADMIAALPARLAPVADAARNSGLTIVSTHFTLVPDQAGEPMISDHLRKLRPFLGKGDFLPGGWGQQLIDDLQPAHFSVEKVAFSAFYMSRLEWVLRRAGIETLVFTGIVTNGGVASTLRDAHVRDFHCILLEDGCGAFSQNAHDSSIQSLSTISHVMTCTNYVEALTATA